MSPTEKRTPDAPGYLAKEGILAWLYSTDHKRIALMHLVGMGGALLLGALTALVMHIELFNAEESLLDASTFGRAFTMQGAVLLFLVMLPGIPATVGSFVLPLRIGARNLAFPRVNLAAFHLWLLGAVFLLLSIMRGGARTGWTLQVPFSIYEGTEVAYLIVSYLALTTATLLRAIVLITTLHNQRAKGITWRHTSPLSWSLHAHSAVTLVAAPVFIVTLLLLLCEHQEGIGVFDPASGGDPLLFQELFWFGAHALIFATILPAIGMAADVLVSLGKTKLFAPRSMQVGIAGLSVVALLSWGVQSPTSGHGVETLSFFSLMLLLALVFGTQVMGSLLGTFRAGAHRAARQVGAPLILVGAFLVTFTLAGLTTLLLGMQSTAVQLHATAFATGHSLLVFGAVGLSLLAGLHFWWPKITGRAYAEKLALTGSLAIFTGLLLTALPRLALGMVGLPQAAATYAPELTGLQVASSTGAFVLFCGLLLTIINLIRSVFTKETAPENPWQADGLEWACPSPPPADNFTELPRL